MKKYFLIMIMVFVGLGIACQTDREISSVNSISHIDFESGGNILLDVRTAEEFSQGNIPNSINLDVQSDSFDLKIQEFDPNKTYYVYCRSGNRSSTAINKLHKMGFHNLIHLKDGYSHYKK